MVASQELPVLVLNINLLIDFYSIFLVHIYITYMDANIYCNNNTQELHNLLSLKPIYLILFWLLVVVGFIMEVK